MEENKPIRIAQVVGKMVGGGVEAYIMNYYRNLDRDKIQFDFIIDSDSTLIPKEEILKLGGNIIMVPPYQHIFTYIKALKKIFKDNNYTIVHSHINALSVFPLYCAYKSNIPVRIAHSHSTTNKKEWKKNLIKNILRPFSRIFANQYFCCTEHAGRWLFGNKFYDLGKVKIINNAIELEKYNYNEKVRNNIRKELNLENKFVIGHVGRFIQQKNHDRLIDIFNEYHKQNENCVLMLIGDGELKEKIINKVKRLNLSQNVLFLGQRNDVANLFQVMDLFLFPSLYEGLGIVLIEAQCSNLQCLASSEVPNVAKINENVKFVSLKKNNNEWLSNISKYNETRCSKLSSLKDAGYNIKEEAKKLESYYMSVCKGDLL